MFNTLTRMGASAAGGYEIEKSLRFNSEDSATLTRTFGTPTNTDKYTWSGWLKRGKFHASAGHYTFLGNEGWAVVRFTADDFYWKENGILMLRSDRKCRDPSSWYHIVLLYDSSLDESTDRAQIWINGVRETSLSSTSYPNQNQNSFINSARAQVLGAYRTNEWFFDGYLAEINFVDGQGLEPDNFGETDATTGQWIPKEYKGTYGNNGYYLNFSDNSNTTSGTLGADLSGNGNDWTPNNFSVAAGAGNDSFTDTPTNNFCTMNPLTAQNTTVSNGALTIAPGGNNSGCYSTMQIPPSGKWYFEMTKNSGSPMIGYSAQPSMPGNYEYSNEADGLITYFYGGRIECYHGGSSVLNVTDSPWDDDADGTVFGILWDRDNDTVKHRYDNGDEVSFNIPSSIQDLPLAFGYSVTTTWPSGSFTYNFGANGFTYTIPTGYSTLSTANLPTPTIKNGTDYFDTSLWAGNDGDTDITGLSFQPNMVWDKCRSTTHDWQRWDSVRGVEESLRQDGDPEATFDDGLVAFNSDGYSFGSNSRNNGSGHTYLGYAWKESASAGFDIVSYTGNGSARTISHSLGVAPEMIIIKCRSESQAWKVGHKHLSGNNWTYRLIFSDNSDQYDAADFNDTAPTSSVFSVGTDDTVNKDTATYIAYLFASVEGYSKIGSYEGNGDTDGPFLYCGFKPAWFMVKRIDADHNWHIIDSKRTTYNPTRYYIMANSNAQGLDSDGAVPFDFVSNGVKLRDDGNAANNSSGTYIYMAFAERPFKYANAR